jgi:hypothetical protein
MKTTEKTMVERVRERVNEEYQQLFDTQVQLRLKQKQIAEKLKQECESQGIDCIIKTNELKKEREYHIELSYGITGKFEAKIIVAPVFAKLGKEQDKHAVYFIGYKQNYSYPRERMIDVAMLFKKIEDDMYKYYNQEPHE